MFTKKILFNGFAWIISDWRKRQKATEREHKRLFLEAGESNTVVRDRKLTKQEILERLGYIVCQNPDPG